MTIEDRVYEYARDRSQSPYCKAGSEYRHCMSEIEPGFHVNSPVTIIGRHIRTDTAQSATDIPALWQEVFKSDLLATVPGKLSDDVYAVYTNLEHAGETNDGHFSFLVGVPVDPSTPAPKEMTMTVIPASIRARFGVPENDRTRVIEAWERAWGYDDRVKTFICEYELYTADGDASVNLGVHETPSGVAVG